MTSGTVTSIHLYPVKGCRGVDVAESVVATTGLADDRQWQISTDKGPLTQRTRPVLATIQPELLDGGLRLSAEGHGSIEVARPTEADTETTALTTVRVAVGDAGDEAAAWLAAVTGEAGVRLHAFPPGTGLDLPSAIDLVDQPIAFGDLSPVLVANTATLDWLVARADEPFGMDRFRANVVVETDEPFVEDTWDRFDLGPVGFRHGAAWPRCAVPQVDQVTGTRHKEPARVLAAHRKVATAPEVPDALKPAFEGKSIFGVGCGAGPVGATLRVGDPLTVTATRAPMLAPPA